MTAPPISAWSRSLELPSPDGELVARYENAGEIGMGGPSSGCVSISDGMRWSDCGASMVGSDDSRYLAVPRWGTRHVMHLVVLSMELKEARNALGELSIVELHTFAEGVIRGVKGPRRPGSVRISYDTAKLDWSQGGRGTGLFSAWGDSA